ncbi:MAG TPA: hypothetical protein VFE93_19150 [Myxococcaceae bacterium]|nr:hypothetical protein [Myxococcaceae bacterium]
MARPSLWLPGNALGWSVGMPRVFLAIGLLARHGPRPSVVASSAAALLVAGALSGLVEGAFLLRMGWRGARSPAPVNV